MSLTVIKMQLFENGSFFQTQHIQMNWKMKLLFEFLSFTYSYFHE
jgi:hypothetical protein